MLRPDVVACQLVGGQHLQSNVANAQLKDLVSPSAARTVVSTYLMMKSLAIGNLGPFVPWMGGGQWRPPGHVLGINAMDRAAAVDASPTCNILRIRWQTWIRESDHLRSDLQGDRGDSVGANLGALSCGCGCFGPLLKVRSQECQRFTTNAMVIGVLRSELFETHGELHGLAGPDEGRAGDCAGMLSVLCFSFGLITCICGLIK